jgi:hypothetical protein
MAEKYRFYLLPFVDEKNTIVSERRNSAWRYSVYIRKIAPSSTRALPLQCYGSEKIACPLH